MNTRDAIKLARRVADTYRVERGERFRLKDVDPGDTGTFKRADKPACVVEIEKDPILGRGIKRHRFTGQRKRDRIIELIHAHEIDGDHEEHDQLKHQVQQGREIDINAF